MDEIHQRLAALRLDPTREAEIIEELAQHLDDRFIELRTAGRSEEQARAAALAELDEHSLLARRLRRVEREVKSEPVVLGHRRGNMLADLGHDLRYGLRTLRKSPGFALVAALTLALGIGANTAIFSVVKKALLEPLPFANPERVVTLWENNTRDGIARDDVSPANFLDWRNAEATQAVFEHIAASNSWTLDHVTTGEPETFRSALVTKGFFEAIGVQPLLGRTFLPEEYQPGRDNVVVMGYSLWRDRFGSDPTVVGRVLPLDRPRTVVGVLPPEFELRLHGRDSNRLFAPQAIPEYWQYQRRATYLKAVARLKPGVTVDQARSVMDSLGARLAQEYPRELTGVGITVVPLDEFLVGQSRPALLVLLGAVGCVLLIACGNVANLLLARATGREKEIAIRAALGASGGRIMRQFLAESLLLALAGGALGVVLSRWVLRGLVVLGAGRVPRLEQASLDGGVLAFAAVLVLLTAFLFGIGPALRALRLDPQPSLGSGRASPASRRAYRLQNALVVAQAGLAVMLLIGAGLLLRSFHRLLTLDPGFTTENVVAMQAFIYSRYSTPEQQLAYSQQVIEKLRTVPGVRAAAVATGLPLFFSGVSSSIAVVAEGQPAPRPGEEPSAFYTYASPDYFAALGIPLLRGRLFNEFDRRGAPLVTVINEAMVKRFWPEDDPVGKRISLRAMGEQVSVEVVGVVASTRGESLQQGPRPQLYLSMNQFTTGSMIFITRTETDVRALIPSIQAAIWEVNRAQPFYWVSTMDELVDRSVADRRFALLLLGSFAGLALLLSAVGIYGVLAYSVSQRTHEIGVRMALGADRRQVFRLVVGQGMLMTMLGAGLGALGAMGLARFLATLLFEVKPTDPVTFAAVVALLGGVALLACAIPARRAMRVDPLVALRYE